jgi:hypothetical protein
MLRDTPLSWSALANLKSRSLVEKAGKKHEMGSLTGRETVQQRYTTVEHSGPFKWLDDRTNLPKSTFEAFAARPEADLYVVNVVFGDVSMVPSIGAGVTRVEDEFGLDVQVVTVAAAGTDTSECPGRVVTVNDVDDRANTSSSIARAIPSADILDVTVGPSRAGAAAELIATVNPEYRLINADSGMFVDRAREFVRHHEEEVTVELPHRGRPDEKRRMLSHFDPGIVVEGEVNFDGGEDGQTTLEELAAHS